MPDLDASIVVDAPVETVFDFVDDWRNTTRYLRNLKRWEPVDPAKARGAGARFAVAFAAGPITIDGTMEVTEHERPGHVAFVSIDGPKASGRWTFTAEGTSTRVDLRNTFELPGGIAGRVVRRFVEAQGRRDLQASLETLKELVEG